MNGVRNIHSTRYPGEGLVVLLYQAMRQRRIQKAVDEAGLVDGVGVQEKDVIVSINRHPVTSVADFTRLAAQAKGETLLRVNRGGESQFLVLSPGGGDNDGGDEEQ